MRRSQRKPENEIADRLDPAASWFIAMLNNSRTANEMNLDETLAIIGSSKYVDTQKAYLARLDNLCCGGIVLSAARDVIAANKWAEIILSESANTKLDLREIRKSFLNFLSKDRTGRSIYNDEWLCIEGRKDELIGVHSTLISDAEFDTPLRIVLLVDLSINPQPSHSVLKSLFKLTDTECKVACAVAKGLAPVEIASLHASSLTTVRTQLHQIRLKTRTTRLAEITALMARIALLS